MTQKTVEVTTQATIEMANISKHYSGVAALTDVSVEILPGEVHAILGENGAGKSTLMNVATGTVQQDAGSIRFQGEPISGLNPRTATSLGIAIVHQHPAVLPDLTRPGEPPGRAAQVRVRRYVDDAGGPGPARWASACRCTSGTGSRR